MKRKLRAKQHLIAAVTKAGLPFKVLDEHIETGSGRMSIKAFR